MKKLKINYLYYLNKNFIKLNKKHFYSVFLAIKSNTLTFS